MKKRKKVYPVLLKAFDFGWEFIGSKKELVAFISKCHKKNKDKMNYVIWIKEIQKGSVLS